MNIHAAPNMSVPMQIEPSLLGLPPKAAAFLSNLRAERDDANDLTNASAERLREAQHEANEFARQAREAGDNTRYGVDPEFAAKCERQAAAARNRVTPLAERHAVHAARWNALAMLVQGLDLFAARYSERTHDGERLVFAAPRLQPWTGPAPTFLKGEKPAEALERHRKTVASLKAEASRVRNARRTKAEAIETAKQFVANTGARAMPDVSPLFRGADPTFFELPGMWQAGQYIGDSGVTIGFPTGPVRDGLAFACWLTPDAVLARLVAQIEAEARDDSRAMTVEARETRLAEIAVELLTAERAEEYCCRQLEALGMQAERRPDADARAVLQVFEETDR